VPEIRKKILYTLMMFLVYRIGAHVPVPGVDADFVASQISNSTLGQFYDLFAGGGLSDFSLFALGITPYITASIIMNLLTVALPPLERLSKEGPEGRKKIASITRYAAVILGLIQSISVLLAIGEGAVIQTGTPMILNYITIVLCLTAGTALIMWIGEHITENGVGNGISLLIFISIISRLPREAIKLVGLAANTDYPDTTYLTVLIVVVAALVIVTGITFIDLGERRIPVQYAKRVIGRKIYGGQSTHIPMKINQSGVLPLIFAITLIQFPSMITGLISSEAQASYESVMGSGQPLYLVLYALLIFFFTFFYSQVTFNPMDVAKNMQQNGGFIPGIRAGKPTSDYLQKILVRITLFGALFLALVATVPTGLSAVAGFSSAFGATSLLIMVSVSLETTRQLESHLMMRHYKGFLK
ncbi:MAG: preprotein translocase subunit SecY, partial [Eubacteriales bacterium]|nr:preprotein translocase subunit SecY [Eubacteriales bacterium]